MYAGGSYAAVSLALKDADLAGVDGDVVAEAIVSLNIWMFVAHKLHEGLGSCRKLETGVTQLDTDLNSIDEAMAYWIGVDQRLDSISGHSMFALAQAAELNFGTDPSTLSGHVAKANVRLKELYEDARLLFSSDKKCLPGSGTYKKLYHITHEMISAMMIPLIMKLIPRILKVYK